MAETFHSQKGLYAEESCIIYCLLRQEVCNRYQNIIPNFLPPLVSNFLRSVQSRSISRYMTSSLLSKQQVHIHDCIPDTTPSLCDSSQVRVLWLNKTCRFTLWALMCRHWQTAFECHPSEQEGKRSFCSLLLHVSSLFVAPTFLLGFGPHPQKNLQ